VSGGLALDGVEIALRGRVLIGPLDLAIAPGDIVTIMGPSGSGKSTLLAFVGGFLDRAFTARGRVRINGTDVTTVASERRRAGILFQDDLLFPHLSVGGNLAFGLAARIKARMERRAAIESALANADLVGFADRDPATLSGGQRARVALLRTLLAEPKALLLDEPFAKLDQQLRAEFRAFVFGHARERSLPILMATHDPDDARAAGGRVIPIGAVDKPTPS
jgi:putative thiamine transport system ATP-binding protein